MQANNAEQNKTGAGRLRGREFSEATEDVLSQVGVHLYASRGSEQSGQEERQAGAQSAGQSRESFLGRPPAHGTLPA